MGFLSNLRKDLQTQKRKKASKINGKKSQRPTEKIQRRKR